MIYTDALQTVIMLVGALTLMGYSKWGPAWQRLSRQGPLSLLAVLQQPHRGRPGPV